MGCDPEAMEQDLRIVCRGGDDSVKSDCAHLFDTSGSGSGSGSSSAGVAVRAVPSASASASASASSAAAPEPSVSALPSDGKEQGAVGKIVRLPQNVRHLPSLSSHLLILAFRISLFNLSAAKAHSHV